ncbi:hypothetical protein F5J12DRAFT_348338 [Pisolithus orientalis]|uniref:uncharacterized protein n=1 Tax=Pisolithus orientalis TaxID=936130 RepID=UPI0022242DFB|nr:uncharacterized protein F5J12DRAFT_348338 [Pisolithus orientalis]KAI5996918.1 hypothetical protein F5J12DRAFT_348338 [Pisolithus orientalis]
MVNVILRQNEKLCTVEPSPSGPYPSFAGFHPYGWPKDITGTECMQHCLFLSGHSSSHKISLIRRRFCRIQRPRSRGTLLQQRKQQYWGSHGLPAWPESKMHVVVVVAEPKMIVERVVNPPSGTGRPPLTTMRTMFTRVYMSAKFDRMFTMICVSCSRRVVGGSQARVPFFDVRWCLRSGPK